MFEVFIVMKIHVVVLFDVTPYSDVVGVTTLKTTAWTKIRFALSNPAQGTDICRRF
jgi:hypothetical protein